MGPRLSFTHVNQRRVGQPVNRHMLIAAGLAPAATIGLINALGGVVSGKKRRLDVTVRSHLRSTARTCCADPYRRVRLLYGTRADVDRPMVEETAPWAARGGGGGRAFVA